MTKKRKPIKMRKIEPWDLNFGERGREGLNIEKRKQIPS